MRVDVGRSELRRGYNGRVMEERWGEDQRQSE